MPPSTCVLYYKKNHVYLLFHSYLKKSKNIFPLVLYFVPARNKEKQMGFIIYVQSHSANSCLINLTREEQMYHLNVGEITLCIK